MHVVSIIIFKPPCETTGRLFYISQEVKPEWDNVLVIYVTFFGRITVIVAIRRIFHEMV